ncbi:MAG: hypothetical protein V4441_07810 [Pseudomonadota bacterium]
MITFFSKSLVSLAVIAVLWNPANAWVGGQQTSALSCRADFSACRVAGTVIPLLDRETVLGQIAAEAKRDPARQLGKEVRRVATSVFEEAVGGVRAQVRKGE